MRNVSNGLWFHSLLNQFVRVKEQVLHWSVICVRIEIVEIESGIFYETFVLQMTGC